MRYTQNVKTIHSSCHQALVKILKAERQKRAIPQTAVAKQLREKQNWMSRVERGMRRVDVCEFLLLSKAIGFNPVKVIRQLTRAKPEPERASIRRRDVKKAR